MGRVNLVLPDDLEAKVRAAVADRMGMKKGNLQVAAVQAFELWLQHGRSPK